jgi:Putative zinc-finger
VSHLGDRLTALVDNQLGPDTRDRLLAHVVHCPECRREGESARLVKSRLAALPAPLPSEALLRRLIELAEPGEPMPPIRRSFPGASRPALLPPPGRPAPTGRPAGRPSPARLSPARLTLRGPSPGWASPGWPSPGRPSSPHRDARAPAPRRGHRASVLAASGLSLAVITLATAFMAGGGADEGTAPVAPPLDSFTAEHHATSGSVAVVDPALRVAGGAFGGATLPTRLAPPAPALAGVPGR